MAKCEAQLVDQAEKIYDGFDAVRSRVDADDGVAAFEQEAVDDAGGDAGGIVGRMVGLQAGGEAAGESDSGAEAGDDANFRGDGDEVLQPHDFGNGRGHFGRDAGREGGEDFAGRLVGKKPVAEFTDGEMRDGGECGGIVIVGNKARYLVDFVGDDKVFAGKL